MQRPRTTTAFAQRPLWMCVVPVELLLRCRRPYCAANKNLKRPTELLLVRHVTAFVLRKLKVHAVVLRSCYSTASTGDMPCIAVVILAIVLRPPGRSAFFLDAVGSPCKRCSGLTGVNTNRLHKFNSFLLML